MPYKDKDKKKEWERKYRETHREEIREQQRQYRESNKEKIAERKRRYQQEYYDTPRGRAIYMVKNLEQADKKYGRGECTITPEWIEKNIFTSKCIYCGETDWKKLGCDRIDNSLPHTPGNVVCACETCNKKRGTMPFEEFVQRFKSGETLLKKNCPGLSKPVFALDAERNVVMEFPSASEARRNGFNNTHIGECCNGKLKTYKGLYWRWGDRPKREKTLFD